MYVPVVSVERVEVPMEVPESSMSSSSSSLPAGGSTVSPHTPQHLSPTLGAIPQVQFFNENNQKLPEVKYIQFLQYYPFALVSVILISS